MARLFCFSALISCRPGRYCCALVETETEREAEKRAVMEGDEGVDIVHDGQRRQDAALSKRGDGHSSSARRTRTSCANSLAKRNPFSVMELDGSVTRSLTSRSSVPESHDSYSRICVYGRPDPSLVEHMRVRRNLVGRHRCHSCLTLHNLDKFSTRYTHGIMVAAWSPEYIICDTAFLETDTTVLRLPSILSPRRHAANRQAPSLIRLSD